MGIIVSWENLERTAIRWGSRMLSNHQSQTLIANRYQPIKELGAGSMGKVYHVLDRLSGQEVALKQVLVDKTSAQVSNDTKEQQNLRLILANEFQTLASLHHPHIISVLDYGFYDGKQPYFTMNLLQNPQTLTKAAENKSVETRINFIIQILQALAYIHRRGLLHRDLKPTNVLCEDEHVFVLDFGLAVQQDSQSNDETVGTLAYIAPEVLLGNPATEPSDLYAVGLMAYELLTGRYPYNLKDSMQLIYDITETPVDLSELDVDEAMIEVLERLLAKSPSDRFPNAQSALVALTHALSLPETIETEAIRDSYLKAASFVGRENERKTLNEALNQLTKAHKGSAWLIGGESGVGKSRLVDEIRTQALVSGVGVLSGQAVSEGGLPYQAWRNPLRRVVLTVTIGDNEAGILKTVIPDLADLVGYPVEDPAESGNDARIRLMQVVEQVLVRSAHKQPVLLILEDLQWSSESLALLQSVLQRVNDTPIMVIGTYRDDERPDLPDDLPNMTVIPLERLNDQEIAELTTSMIGKAGMQPHVVHLLQKETEGNVFFLVEVVRVLAEEAGSLSEIGQATLPPQVFAGGVEQVITRRLTRIPEWARPLMNLVAVAGRQLDSDIIAYLLNNNPAILQDTEVTFIKHSFDEWLTMCNYATILEAQDGEWRFFHDKLREGVISRIEPEKLPAIHRQVAEAIETVYADRLTDYAYVLTRHWATAGDTIKEGHYAFLASLELDKVNEFREMRRLLERAFELKAHKHVPDPTRELAHMTQHMGRTLFVFGELDAAREWQQNARSLYEKLDDALGIADTIGALGELDLHQNKNKEAITLIEDSLRRYEALGAMTKIGNATMRLGIAQSNLGNLDASLAYFEKGYAILKETGEKLSIARAILNLAIIHDALGHIEKALELHEESLALRKELNDRRGIGYSLVNMGAIAQDQGDIEKARRLIVEAVYHLRTVGENRPLATALHSLGSIEVTLQHYEESFKAYREALIIRKQSGNIADVVQVLGSLGNLEVTQGDFSSAYHYFREALQTILTDDNQRQANNILWDIATMLTKAEDRQRALTYLYWVKRNKQQFGQNYTEERLAEEIQKLEFRLRKQAIDTARADAETLNVTDVILFLSSTGHLYHKEDED